MRGDIIRARVLSTQLIPNGDPGLLQALGARPGERSLAILTTDSDDPSYVALDEATKHAGVRVLYAKSLYAGAQNASTALAGEFIGILAAPDPAQATSGLRAALDCLRGEAHFLSAAEGDGIVYFAHCVSRTGSYLSQLAGLAPGQPLAYLIAPPAEALVGVDAALKAADVRMAAFYGPPTETNFAGALLTGSQAACREACAAFGRRVCEAADNPLYCE